MEQSEIHYRNTLTKILTGDYRNARYMTIGQIIHYLRSYGLIQYDLCIIGKNSVELFGKEIATFVFDDDKQLPVFTFIKDEEYEHLEFKQEYYLKYKDVYGNLYNDLVDREL